jgi:phenylacetate-CoA ligase
MKTNLSREEIDKITDRKIRSTITSAYRDSKFWRKKFDSLVIKPEEIGGREDLLDAFKSGLMMSREEIPFALPDNFDGYKEEIWTSGTDGKPKIIYYSLSDLYESNQQCVFAYDITGLRDGDKVAALLAPSPFASGTLSREGFKMFKIDALYTRPPQITKDMPEKEKEFLIRSFAETIKRKQPDYIMGLTTQLYQLPPLLASYGYNVKDFNIRNIVTCAEASTKERRKIISEEWGAEVCDLHASSECSVMAAECIEHLGLHVNETNLFMTFVNSEGKETDSELGTDLVTVLHDEDAKTARYIINYSHGDVGRILSYERCRCGRTFKRIDHPSRNDEVISLVGAKLYIRDVEPLLSPPIFTGEYVVTLGWDGSRKPALNYRVEITDAVLLPPIGDFEEKVLYQLLGSNPTAIGLIKTGAEFGVSYCEKGKLYAGLEKYIKPGKPIRLIRTNI